MNRCATRLCVLSVLLVTTTAIADDAQSIFDSLFRERIRQVKASSNDSDDLALATDMLAALDSVDDKQLVSLICENVFTLAPRSADGLTLATNSMQQLAAKLPDQRRSALVRIADLYKSAYFRARGEARTTLGPMYAEAVASLGDAQFDAGDWQAAIVSYRRAAAPALKLNISRRTALLSRINTATDRIQLDRKIKTLQATLDANPNDQPTAKALALIHLAHLNDMDAASTAALQSGDAKLIERIKLAGLASAKLTEVQLLDLGDWFRSLAITANAPSKTNLLSLAHHYNQRFLEQHEAKGLSRTKAEITSRSIEANLKRLGVDTSQIATHLPQHLFENKTEPLVTSKPDHPTKKETWISKDATYQPSSQLTVYRPLPALLTGSDQLHLSNGVPEFAFSTNGSRPGAYIVIDLGKTKTIKRIWIENRRSVAQYARAKGLTLWLSNQEGKRGGKVWTADKPTAEWTVKLHRPVNARYITLSLPNDSREHLHLAHVKVFGSELSDSVKEGQPSTSDTPISIQPKDGWVELIKLTKPPTDEKKHQWTRKGESLVSPKVEYSRQTFSAAPASDYMIRIKFVRHSKQQGIHVFLPIGNTCAAIVFDGRTKESVASGLEMVAGNGLGKTTSIAGKRLVTGKSHVIETTVKLTGQTGTIHADLDGQPIVRWTGNINLLTPYKGWRVKDRTKLSVGSHCTIQIDSFQLRMLSGKASVAAP